MRCHICSTVKLRKEFPSKPLSSECEHAPLYCLRCAVQAAEDEGQCPCCEKDVDMSRVEDYKQRLDLLFPKVKTTLPDISDIALSGEEIFVTTIDGERTPIPFSSSLSVAMLKEEIAKKTKVDINKQKLLFQEQDLMIYDDNGELQVVGNYGITKGATIHLMVLLYAIPDHMDHVIFDLSWGYPPSGRDFLDASCLVYSDSKHQGTVNYDEKSWPSDIDAIQHSGDGTNESNTRGYHTIDVFLKKVPKNVTHLFFTLSVWTNPSIAHFPDPVLRFFDASNKAKDLCNTSIGHATDSEAVIMCYVVRKKNKKGWDIFESGHLSAGNANNYEPIYETVTSIISGKVAGKVSKGSVNPATPAAVSSSSSARSNTGPRPIEIVFCFDTTGSMYSYLDTVKRKVKEIIARLLRDIPSLRIAVFVHGDYDTNPPYTTKFVNFTNDKNRLCNFVEEAEQTRGGGPPECYELALYEIKGKLSWSSDANKSLIMIGDAHPHPPTDYENHLNLDWRKEAKDLFQKKGVRIYAIQCNDISESTFFWKEVAVIGHGKHFQLNKFEAIVNLLLAICYREGAPSLLRKFEKEVKDTGAMGSAMSSLFSRPT